MKNKKAFILFIFIVIESISVISIELIDSLYLIHTTTLIINILIVYSFFLFSKKKTQNSEIDTEYKQILDAIADIVFIISTSGKILFINKQVNNILGYEPDHIKGENFIKFVPKKEKIKYIKKLKEVFLTKQILPFETYILNNKGQEFPVEISAKIMEYKERNVVIGSIHDIYNRKKAEKALVESEKNFRLIFENAPFGIYTATPEGNIIDINNEAIQILGSPSIEATKKINLLTFQPLIDNGYAAAFKQCIKNGQKINFEKTYQSIWGKKVTILSQLIPLKKEQGKIAKIYTVMQDISAQKLAEHKLKEQNKEYAKLVSQYQNQNKKLIEARLNADESNRLKTEFLTNMSHEIRTPMNAIIGFSEVLQMQLNDQNHLSFVDKIMTSGNRLLELINDILDLSKIEAKQIEIKAEKIELKLIFDEVLLIFSGIAKQKNIPIELNISDNIPKYVLFDAFRLKQILMNLISNALKFTKKGKVSINVQAKLLNNKELFDLFIEISDTGIGIPEENFQCIFQSFNRINQDDEHLYGGTGLGLSITRQLVELMNGHISVKSKIGIGSEFTILFREVKITN